MDVNAELSFIPDTAVRQLNLQLRAVDVLRFSEIVPRRNNLTINNPLSLILRSFSDSLQCLYIAATGIGCQFVCNIKVNEQCLLQKEMAKYPGKKG